MDALVPSKKTGAVFLAIYITLLIGAIIVLLAVSKEEEGIRHVAGFIAYGTGLPVLIAAGLHWFEKRGWLREKPKK